MNYILFLFIASWMSIIVLVSRKLENQRENNDKHGILLFNPQLDKI